VTSPQKFYGWKLVGVLFILDFLNMGFPFFGGAVINTYMLKQIPMAIRQALSAKGPILIGVNVQKGGLTTFGMDRSVSPPNYG
jgi:hypothetical protein